jgi:uncharacterized protein
MRLRRYERPAEFIDAAGPLLLANEAEHNLILGLAAGLAHGEWSEHPPYLAVVEDRGAVVLAALRTPPRNVVLSRCADLGAVDLLVSDLGQRLRSLPGATGGTQVAGAFASGWCSASGGAAEVAMSQRIYQVDRVVPASGVRGRLRPVSLDDRPLLVGWLEDFSKAESAITHDDAAQVADRFLRADFQTRGLYVWENDGEAVAMVGHSGPTPNGMRVGPVYTPPAHRRKGYASAATAVLSQRLLDSGRRFCFLYTDLANPTSNHIYQAIGYRPVADSVHYRFSV